MPRVQENLMSQSNFTSQCFVLSLLIFFLSTILCTKISVCKIPSTKTGPLQTLNKGKLGVIASGVDLV